MAVSDGTVEALVAQDLRSLARQFEDMFAYCKRTGVCVCVFVFLFA